MTDHKYLQISFCYFGLVSCVKFVSYSTKYFHLIITSLKIESHFITQKPLSER